MYNIGDLDPREFERLSKTILDFKLNKKFEIFPEGKDRGIDLRYISEKIIVQSKRYKNWSDLKRTMKGEVEKVKKLISNSEIDRYIIVTSCQLSLANKDELIELFEEIKLKNDDIFSYEEINDLLKENTYLVNNHFQLWIPALEVLGLIINKTQNMEVSHLIKNIEKNKKIYVETKLLRKAYNVLVDKKVVLITGSAGVGKTTLCEMLIAKILNKSKSKVKLSYSAISSVEEISKMISVDSDVPEIIYFDDFIGKTYADLKSSNLKRLTDFLNSNIEGNLKNKYIILNSRISILEKVKDAELLFGDTIDNIDSILIDANKITIKEKAMILYKHLKKSNISQKHLTDIVKNKDYENIIEHKNYNPRIIEFVTLNNRLNKISPDTNYYSYVINNLNNPFEIWEEVFKKMNDNEKYICYLIVSISNKSELKVAELELAYNNLVKKHDFLRYKETSFSTNIKHMSRSTIKIYENDTIELNNPSIYDYINSVFEKDIAVSQNIIDAAKYFSQIEYSLSRNKNIDLPKYDYEKIVNIKSKKRYTYIEDNEKEKSLGVIDIIVNCTHNNEELKKTLLLLFENQKGFDFSKLVLMDEKKYAFYDVSRLIKENTYLYLSDVNETSYNKISFISIILRDTVGKKVVEEINNDFIEEIIDKYLLEYFPYITSKSKIGDILNRYYNSYNNKKGDKNLGLFSNVYRETEIVEEIIEEILNNHSYILGEFKYIIKELPNINCKEMFLRMLRKQLLKNNLPHIFRQNENKSDELFSEETKIKEEDNLGDFEHELFKKLMEDAE